METSLLTNTVTAKAELYENTHTTSELRAIAVSYDSTDIDKASAKLALFWKRTEMGLEA